MTKDRIFSIYKKIRINPDPDIFTLMIVVTILSLVFSFYNNYQIRNGQYVSGNVTPEGKKVLPIKDLIKNIKPNEPRIGNKDAKVVMVAFEDFQCPFCKKFHDETFERIKKDYVDTGKVLFIHADLSFLGPESIDSSEAAACANEQGMFWEYRDILYKRQVPEHNAGKFSEENLKGMAKELKLDLSKFNDCFDSGKYSKEITSAREFAESYGINSTPTFIINGQIIKGARQYFDFSTAINNALK